MKGLWRLKSGDRVEVSGEKWATVLIVPFGFPWLSQCVTIDSGWPVHKDHITAITKRPK